VLGSLGRVRPADATLTYSVEEAAAIRWSGICELANAKTSRLELEPSVIGWLHSTSRWRSEV
jgi:hypothetical protein